MNDVTKIKMPFGKEKIAFPCYKVTNIESASSLTIRVINRSYAIINATTLCKHKVEINGFHLLKAQKCKHLKERTLSRPVAAIFVKLDTFTVCVTSSIEVH